MSDKFIMLKGNLYNINFVVSIIPDYRSYNLSVMRSNGWSSITVNYKTKQELEEDYRRIKNILQ